MNRFLQKFRKLLEQPWFALTFALCTAVLFYVLLSHASFVIGGLRFILNTLSSVFIGIVLAYLINPVVSLFENRFHTSHSLAVLLALIFAAVILVLCFVLVVPSLFSSFNTLAENISSYAGNSEELINLIVERADSLGIDLSLIADKANELFRSILNRLPAYAGSALKHSFRVGSGVINWFIGIIFAVYFLNGKQSILQALDQFRRVLLKDETYEKHNRFFSRCNTILIQYIWFSLIDAVIIGMATALFMFIARMPYTAIVSFICGITNLVPTFGPVAGSLICAFILILVKPSYALLFLLFTMILQFLDGYVIKPKLFSGSLGIPAMFILIAVILGGKLFGVIGMLMAIPAAAILTFTYNDVFFPYLQNRKQRIINK